MQLGLLVGLLAGGGCTKAGPGEPTAAAAPDPAVPEPAPGYQLPPPAPPVPPPAPVTVSPVTVQMTAATLAADCGGRAAPPPPPSAGTATAVRTARRAEMAEGAPKPKLKAEAGVEGARLDSARMARRQCEQTSMQLSVVAGPGGSPTALAVKKVELFDESGALLGELTARTPTVWAASGVYQPWDQMVAPAQTLSVSYELSEPNWAGVASRWNKTYVLKAVISVGAGDQTTQKDVHVTAPTIMPAHVRT